MTPTPSEQPRIDAPARRGSAACSLALVGALCILLGGVLYLSAIALSVLRSVEPLRPAVTRIVVSTLWYSGVPTVVGFVLCGIDFFVFLPRKRRTPRHLSPSLDPPRVVDVALTAYNDELSIGAAVADFRAHPRVRRVLVVDNNSRDATADRARSAGAEVVIEDQPGYGRCVYRCLAELSTSECSHVVLCEGDCTFRAADLDKFLAYASHTDIVNGTRVVEQLRAYDTQLSTFMFYGNFFVGKLLELKHLGRGTFTDVGTTYKLLNRAQISRLLAAVDPRVNLEFNAHLLDRALSIGLSIVECPITFHPRVGVSKGGNVSNRRAFRVGMRMILGLIAGWTPVRLLSR